MKVENAKRIPEIYYGLHFCPGVAEYADPQGTDGSYRILVNEDTIREMNPSFAGRPVYVRHVDEVNMEKLQEEADGYVVESFYNALDGKTWAKFIVVSDKGHEAIAAGWKLSNAYFPKEFGPGGRWHNVDFAKEVKRAEFEHLAIVPNPRYEESIILTPEQFKAYNSQKELELRKLSNSKEKKKSMFNFFKKTKLENAAELQEATVVLKNGRELTVAQLINEAEEASEKKEEKKENVDMPAAEMPMCNMEHMVEVGGEKMSLNALVEKHMAMKSELEEMKKPKEEAKKEDSAEDEEAKKKALEIAEHEDKEIEAEKKQNDSHFEALKNAHLTAKETSVDLSDDKVNRGKNRYGSGQ